jgi:hypothetical protein
MTKKNIFHIKTQFKPQTDIDEASLIQGFDIELNKHDAERIDRLVDNYESCILSHLDDEYLRKTTFSNRLADRLAEFGGSWKFIIWFGVFLAIWIVCNTLDLTKPKIHRLQCKTTSVPALLSSVST